MTTPTLLVEIDTAEPRVSRDRIAALVDGRHWDVMNPPTTAFVDGITRTGMLMPLPYTPAWQTTTSGLYARLGVKDYTFYNPPAALPGTPPPYPLGSPTDPTKWVEHHWPIQGSIYLVGQGVNDMALTNASWDRNRAFFLSWFSFNSGHTSVVQMECGWISDDAYIALRIWTDGKCEVYKNGTQVGEGNIYERHVTTQTVYGKERISGHRAKAAKGDARSLAQQVVDLLIIPCRRRDILLLSNQGGGFRFTFDDLDADNPDNTITPAGRFFWRVPVGQPSVQLAPLAYLTSGNLVSAVRTARLAPGGSESPTITGYADQPGFGSGGFNVSVLEPDGVSAFVPDGVKTQVRLQAALTGDGTATPWFYGASVVYDSIIAETDSNSITDLTPYIVSADLSVPESAGDVCFKVVCKSPGAIEAAGAVAIRTVGNRPVECGMSDGTVSIAFLTGRSKSPSWRESINDGARRLMLEFRDRCKAMEDYRVKEPLPWDGMELADAMATCVMLPGYPAGDIDIPAFGFNLPTVGEASQGEWALIPEVGEKAIESFTKLWQTFAPHTMWGWVPTIAGPVFQVRTLDELESDVSQVTLYATIDDAVSIGGIERRYAAYYVYRSMEPTRIECEANDIWVTGRDPRTGAPFLTHYADKKSQDPTLAPAQRPANWVGEPREYGWGDPAITDKDTAAWVCAALARRLTVVRDVVPFECFYQFRADGAPVWRGQNITLWGIGKVNVKTFSGQCVTEHSGNDPTGDRIWRPFHYTGEIVYPPTV